MKSTNYNITNPMKIDDIELIPYMELIDLPIVKCITQAEYNEMRYHDPYTIYVISDIPKRAYRGTMLIDTNNKMCAYFLGTKIIDNKVYYVIYMNKNGSMIDICKYVSSNDALKTLTLFNCIGHELIDVQIYSILKSYIDEDIDFLSMIISIMSKLGFKDHPDLQKIIELQNLNNYRCRHNKDVPLIIIEEFNSRLRNHIDNSIVNTYKEIYELLYEIKLDDKLDNITRSIMNIGYKYRLI